ncbi:UBE2T [Lepeophtheirus salmonis]|uniref:Ubiquitin-conjugating enzyme E2 T n=1 Tax=Lepeophtheirus salmonis TaxID=72036 RepID=A0A7R8CFJ0_LEPSM|nr:UBE2T [Lepeophtheirus salmonis]CAF2806972.1 UBE2T [Lepeophtheirus salmonis]
MNHVLLLHSKVNEMIRNSRIKKELEMLEKNPPPGVSCAAPDNGNLTSLEANILGARILLMKAVFLKLSIHIPETYPFNPPIVQFKTRIYHPNVDAAGRICLDLLKIPPKGSWKASLNISSILMSIRLLMNEPNPDDPLMAEIAEVFTKNYETYKKRARDWTQKYANG